ncbi:hypothetical protein OG500_20880 [Kitasatospora sp. NBC_01250]|uniref:hypothetical protein n=1 Tax=Kitasatospora sp. NBC_01250 TaxID=2903571 RepID=UPI002E32A486|nr:hypothetical protein [Kitasatospora sp. NBC_01250]
MKKAARTPAAQAQPAVPGEKLMWASMVGCLAAALAAPLFGDDPTGVVIPVLMATSIGGRLAWFRRQRGQA